ncbi:hypothetical protein [Mycolicibacterium lutetiense]
MTRSRALPDGGISDAQVEYDAQRASAGLIIGEATQVSAIGDGAYLSTPGTSTTPPWLRSSAPSFCDSTDRTPERTTLCPKLIHANNMLATAGWAEYASGPPRTGAIEPGLRRRPHLWG